MLKYDLNSETNILILHQHLVQPQVDLTFLVTSKKRSSAKNSHPSGSLAKVLCMLMGQ